MIDERFPVVEIKKEDKTTFFTDVSGIAKTREWAKRLFSQCQITHINQDHISDEIIKKTMKEFSGKIRECIDPSRIILHKALFVEEYIDKQMEIKRFNDKTQKYVSRINKDLTRKYELLQEYIPECRVVEKDTPVYADEMHKWGLAPMHYTEDYYYEIYNKIERIVGENSR